MRGSVRRLVYLDLLASALAWAARRRCDMIRLRRRGAREGSCGWPQEALDQRQSLWLRMVRRGSMTGSMTGSMPGQCGTVYSVVIKIRPVQGIA